MSGGEPTFLTKLRWNLPWLVRYPFSRAGSFLQRTAFENKHLVFVIANHFEPGWAHDRVLDHKTQVKRLIAYHKLARSTGAAVLDDDGTKFRHTNFYPAEQYHPEILDIMSEMQSEGLGEIEVHLHHGVGRPDTAENLRASLIDFRDTLAEKHRALSRFDPGGTPMYAFVHGNLALANSCGGRFCGVDNEIEILGETGCYVDMTLPSAPDQSQVQTINSIYTCGFPVNQKVPHRTGPRVEVSGREPSLPLIFTGPLAFDWTRRRSGIPVPRLDDGALTANQRLSAARLDRWTSTNITVDGRPDWLFIKLYCHGFFDNDQDACIGEGARRFFSDIVEQGQKSGKYKVHFASAREAFNMVLAAVDGKHGDPALFRDYKLRTIMSESSQSESTTAAG
jgi:hypothetical protein